MFNEVKTHELTIDVVVFTIKDNKLQVLVTRRNKEPFKGRWAIPGGYIRLSETLDDAAARILKEKTDVDDIYLEQLYTFGDPLRYPNAMSLLVLILHSLEQKMLSIFSQENKVKMLLGTTFIRCLKWHSTTKRLSNIRFIELVKDWNISRFHTNF